MNVFVLMAWIVQVLIGVAVLARWLVRRPVESHFPGGLVAAHILSVVAGLALWIVFVVTGVVWWAWGAFVVLTLVNTFGDRMMTLSFRGRSARVRGWADYGAAIGEVFRFRRPLNAVHALMAGVVYFPALAACIIASIPR